MGFRCGDLQQVGAGNADAALAEDLRGAAQRGVDFSLRPLIEVDHAQLQGLRCGSRGRQVAYCGAVFNAQRQGFVRAYCRDEQDAKGGDEGFELLSARHGADGGVIDQNLGNLSCALVWRSPDPAFLGLLTELSTEIVHAFSCHAPERGVLLLHIRPGGWSVSVKK